MTRTIEIVGPALHEGQRAVWDSRARFRVLACGRRWGKSILALAACIAEMAKSNARAWYVAPSFRMVDLHWRTFRSMTPPEAEVQFNLMDRRAVFPNGSELSFRSADNPDSLRGAGLDFLVVDEAAFVPGFEQAWTAALRATLTDRAGRALIISTPNGTDFFHAMFQRGLDPGHPEWESFLYPSVTNPYLPLGAVDEARLELPDRIFRQEFLAEFITDGGQVLRRVDDAVYTDAPLRGQRVVLGIDWGKRDDFTVFTVLDADTGYVLAMDRMNQIDYRVQTQRLGVLCERWQPEVIVAEQNSMGEPLIEQLRAEGLPVQGFQTTNASKGRIIDALAVAFERGDIHIPADPILLNECKSYTIERLPGGSFRYSAPPGQHDDCVMSLALAWEARSCAAMSWGWV